MYSKIKKTISPHCLYDTSIVRTWDFSELNMELDSWEKVKYYSAFSMIIVKDGETIFQRSSNGHTPHTAEYVMSAGKWYMAACVMTLVDDGKLSLDDEVGKWIPEYRNDPKGKATLSQLLSHTAGYPAYQPKITDDYQTLQESVAALLPLPLESGPGTEWNYGGLSMQVAGHMAEVASGMSWEELWQAKMTEPLKMSETSWLPVDKNHAPKLAGGVRTSLHDCSNFMMMLIQNGVFDGKRILSKDAIIEMGRDQVKDANFKTGGLETFVKVQCGGNHHGIYGLGHWREKVDESNKVLIESSPGWSGTYPWIDHENNLFGIFFGDGYNTPVILMYLSSKLPRIISEIMRTQNK